MLEPHIAERAIQIDGRDLYHREAGTGSPLLLLHGLGHSSTAWLRTMPLLAPHYHTLALDLPDLRHQSAGPIDVEPQTLATKVARCIETLRLGSVSIVGNSLGGLVAMLATLARPELVRALVLVDPVGFTVPPVPPLDEAVLALLSFWLALPHRPAALVRAGYAASFYDQSRVDEETVAELTRYSPTPYGQRLRSRALHEIFSFSRHLAGFHARLARLRLPILVVWGKNDPVLPVKDAAKARRVLPNPRLELLERCGHHPHIELPAVFSSIVLDFLSDA